MEPWIVPINAIGPKNSSKNKLNNKIIYNYHPNLNAHLIYRDNLFKTK